jgi:hypothetical protein
MRVMRRPIALSHSERGMTAFCIPTGVCQGTHLRGSHRFLVDGKLAGKVPDVLNFAKNRRRGAW